MKTVSIAGTQAVHSIEIRDIDDTRDICGQQWTPENGDQHLGFTSASNAHRYVAKLLRKNGWPNATEWVISPFDGGASLYLVNEKY